MITPESIDRIKSLPVLDVVRHYVDDLKKNGANYKARSPFTEEKTPSFYVVPAKNIFKCFSSGKGGDAIKFVMELRSITWIEAIKEIANVTGERLEYVTADPATEREQDDRENLYKINEAAALQYVKQLMETDGTHVAFREVIDKRLFTPDTIAQWQIGYAPDQWQFLTDKLKEKALIGPGLEVGLIKEKDQRHYDVFRHRVMYPIHDTWGRVVGFGGRHLAPDANNPKYMNTGETKLFNKSKVLYGLHFAAWAIRKRGYANLVEGYTDVISFHQAGQANTVGTCGTSLTDDQCQLLRKYTGRVVIFPDSDPAGEKSALRSIDLLMKHGFETGVVPLPEVPGHKIDPDEFTRMYKSVESVEI